MAYLNREEREQLARELTKMSVSRARGKLRRMDPQVRLAYMRNAQASGEYLTRLDLKGLGTVVTLVERETETQTYTNKAGAAPIRLKTEYALTEVIVQPMPENQT